MVDFLFREELRDNGGGGGASVRAEREFFLGGDWSVLG